MIPTIINEAVPVPPPAYHRAQARLGPALHIDALTDGSTPCICWLCAVWLCAWPIVDVHPLYPAAQEELRERTAKHLCFSLRSCGRCGGSPIKICATGTPLAEQP